MSKARLSYNHFYGMPLALCKARYVRVFRSAFKVDRYLKKPPARLVWLSGQVALGSAVALASLLHIHESPDYANYYFEL